MKLFVWVDEEYMRLTNCVRNAVSKLRIIQYFYWAKICSYMQGFFPGGTQGYAYL